MAGFSIRSGQLRTALQVNLVTGRSVDSEITRIRMSSKTSYINPDSKCTYGFAVLCKTIYCLLCATLCTTAPRVDENSVKTFLHGPPNRPTKPWKYQSKIVPNGSYRAVQNSVRQSISQWRGTCLCVCLCVRVFSNGSAHFRSVLPTKTRKISKTTNRALTVIRRQWWSKMSTKCVLDRI